MKKLAVFIMFVAVAAMAQDTVRSQSHVQAGELEQLRFQLREKLALAMEQATPECEKARQAATALQLKLKGKNAAEQKAIMGKERARVQAQLNTGIDELNKVSAQINSEMEQAKQQIMAQVQEKMQELKDIETRIKVMGGGKGGN
jgi:xanthine dehydrogenase molybdopterin-binding subunit B